MSDNIGRVAAGDGPAAGKTRRQRRPTGAPPPLPHPVTITTTAWLVVAAVVLTAAFVATQHTPWLRIEDRASTWLLRQLAGIRTPWLTDVANGIKAAGTGWYKDTGSGMGPTLNTAAAMDGYTLSDRDTWLNFKNRQNLKVVVEGDKRLFNQYGVMLVNPAKQPHVKQAPGRKFIEWLTSPHGQQTIAAYKINGEQLFFPDAKAQGS